jgi:hypothetical protein
VKPDEALLYIKDLEVERVNPVSEYNSSYRAR